jgi:hypothetical protein
MSTRRLQDRYGVVWLVWQVLPGTRGRTGTPVPEDGAEGCLTFECDSEKRRVRPIPPRWMEYSDDELRAMCRMAAPVRGGRTERRRVAKVANAHPRAHP